MSLALVHARYQFLETIRIPVAVIGSVFFPAAAMVFFVVPWIGDDPHASTLATGSMMVFAVMVSGLFTYGAGVAEDRASPWEVYVKALPIGPFPRFAGRLLNGTAFQLMALLPVVAIAALFTAATVTPVRLLAGIGALLLAAVPFTLMGLAIGFSMPSKAAIAVANVLFLPMAFAGGLLFGPGRAPGFIEAISPYTPARGPVELVWAAISDFSPNPVALASAAAWTLVIGTLAVAAYRRDEGRRFR